MLHSVWPSVDAAENGLLVTVFPFALCFSCIALTTQVSLYYWPALLHHKHTAGHGLKACAVLHAQTPTSQTSYQAVRQQASTLDDNVCCSHMKPFAGSEMVIDINEFDTNWQKVAGHTFTMQKSFFNPHDFAVTENYYVFFQNPMSFAMVWHRRLQQSGICAYGNTRDLHVLLLRCQVIASVHCYCVLPGMPL